MTAAVSWSLIGKVATFLVAWLAVLATSAIVELYWPWVYELVVEGAIGLGLIWLIFWRRRTP